jgi:hypothetical protein
VLSGRAGIDQRSVDIPKQKASSRHDEAHTLGAFPESEIEIFPLKVVTDGPGPAT